MRDNVRHANMAQHCHIVLQMHTEETYLKDEEK
jgi:hypothetical protein